MIEAKNNGKKQKNKAIGKKVAEIIWVSIGLLIALTGIVFLVLSMIINNLGSNTGVMTGNPFAGLIDAQIAFKKWWNGWFFIKMSSFAGLGSWLVIIACVYLLIVFAVYASKQDAKEKKDKAKKLRERNAMKFKEQVAEKTSEVEQVEAAQ